MPDNYKDIIQFADFIENEIEGIDKINFEYPIEITDEQGKKQNIIWNKVFQENCISWKWFHNRVPLFDCDQTQDIYTNLNKLQNRETVSFKAMKSEKELWSLFSSDYELPQETCEYPHSAITILPNGDATFCTDFPDIILGNIYKQSIHDIWAGERSNKFRDYLNTKGSFPICGRCVHKDEKFDIVR